MTTSFDAVRRALADAETETKRQLDELRMQFRVAAEDLQESRERLDIALDLLVAANNLTKDYTAEVVESCLEARRKARRAAVS